MSSHASLIIRSPAGQERRFELTGEQVSVGRATPGNQPDIALGPDPRKWIGRTHCTLRMRGGIWSVSDNATVNGTLLRRSGTFQQVEEDIRLHDGDELHIPGNITADGKPLYWRLRFVDPHTTQHAPFTVGAMDVMDVMGVAPAQPEPPCLEYDWAAAHVFRRAGGERVQISGLRPQAHQLVRYMMQRSKEQHTSVLVFSYDELAAALWGDPRGWAHAKAHTREDVRDVVSDLRQQIEIDRENPVVLQTVRNIGYRLIAWAPPE